MRNDSSLGERLRQAQVRWGGFVLIVERTTSTNDLALRYARRGAPHGSIVIAHEQTAGRGRFGRTWESNLGGLYLSVILKPAPADPIALLPHLTAVAAAEALMELTALDVRLHWPNDVYTSGRKLGGILCEGSFRGSQPEAFVAGIGINVNQDSRRFSEEVRSRAFDLGEHALDELDVAARIVARLETWWAASREPGRIVSRFRELVEGDSDRRVRVHPRDSDPFDASTRGIAADGGLKVQLDDDSERVLYSEDVVHLQDRGGVE